MTRVPTWIAQLSLLLAVYVAPSAYGGNPVATLIDPSESEQVLRDTRELRRMAELLCRYQLLTAPVSSRLPDTLSPSTLIRQEDLGFLQVQPSRVPLTDLDRPGLYSALARFVQCEVLGVRRLGDRAEVSVRYTRPRWEDPSLRTPEVLTPESQTRRLMALSRWTRRHPDTITAEHMLRFERTHSGWRADYQLPEEEDRRLHPLVVSQCPAVSDGSTVSAFASEMTPPRYLSGRMPRYTQEAFEAHVHGMFVARCLLTREGEVKECCLLKSLPYMEEVVLRALSHMRFAPVTHQGQPVDMEYDFRFLLMIPQGSGHPAVELILTP